MSHCLFPLFICKLNQIYFKNVFLLCIYVLQILKINEKKQSIVDVFFPVVNIYIIYSERQMTEEPKG